jgi:hypothetical protein
MIALGVSVALLAYRGAERTARVEQTFKLIEDLNLPRSGSDMEAAEQQQKAMLRYFPDRYSYPIGTTLSADDARSLLKAARNPEDENYSRWNTARRHLNRFVPVAFAYVHGLGDPKLLADAECLGLVRSNKYFEKLIEVFGGPQGFGRLQPWQVLREAVTKMKEDYPKACAE